MNLAVISVFVYHNSAVSEMEWNDSAYSIEAFVRIGVLIETRVLN